MSDASANTPANDRPPTQTSASGGTGASAPVPVAPAPIVQPPGQDLTLMQRIERALENLVVLRVTTVVGNVTATGADQFNQITGLKIAPDDQQVASTSINMLLGDSSLILSPSFVDNAAYKALHSEAVTQALSIRKQTVDLLKDAYESFKDKIFH